MELKNFFAQDNQGNIIPNPTVYLYSPGTTTPATGLQDQSGAALTNPFNGNANGQIQVQAPDGNYDMRVVGASRDFTMRVRFIDSPTNSANVLRSDLAATTGASLVCFSQPFAGSISRTLQDKNAERVSVCDFGIFPDGVTNWEGTNPNGCWTAMINALKAGKVVVWPTGYYATSFNMDNTMSGAKMHFEQGAIFGSVLHMISSASIVFSQITSISLTANVVTVVTATPHGFTNGQLIQIDNVIATGTGVTDFNGDSLVATVLNATTFTYPLSGANAVGVVTSGALCSETPIKDVVITGQFTTTDRLGSINSKNCYIQKAWVKSDPAHHSFYPGTTCRGAHFYAGTNGLRIDELIIDDASGANTDAALAMDGNAWNPKNCKFGLVHIKDSDYHGAYITGGGHTFRELKIDGFARGVYAGTLQDSDGAVQSQQVKGLWLNRCWDTHIDVLRTSQNIAGSRGYEQNQVVIDETGSAYFGAPNKGIMINAWYAKNVRRSGINFADRIANSGRCNVKVGTMEVSLSPEGLTAGLYAVNAIGAASGSDVMIDSLRFIDTAANSLLYTETTSSVSIRHFKANALNAQAILARGKIQIPDVELVWAGGSYASPVIYLQNPAIAGSYIHNLTFTSPGAITTRLFLADAGGFMIGNIQSSGIRDNVGTVYINGCANWSIRGFQMTSPDNSGIGVAFSSFATDFYLGGGVVAGFAKGFAKGAATFTRGTAVGLNGNGSVTPTDIPSGAIQMLGCNGVTL